MNSTDAPTTTGTERFEFDFTTSVLYIVLDTEKIDFTIFSAQLWNDLTLERMSDVNDIAVEYNKHISNVKRHVPYREEGVRIIKEINRICKEHLEWVIKLTEKQMKKNPHAMTKSKVYAVQVDRETNTIVCLSCAKPPTDGKKLLKCSKCLLAHYCGATCQKENWKSHKPNCC